ncbi:N-glycosylase/DNA lyase [Candidatus Woesearchaeota archaeon]|nr:N-glycosylase/DNA lyase [Candidatus Woesearchaeota archaeon]
MTKELWDHYEKIKNTIHSRLKEFKQPKNKKEIFRELCFCILAANTSSRMASRVMENVGDVIFYGSEEQIKEKLHSLSCRFYNRRANFIYHAQKIDIKYDRDYLVENFKGIGYKEASHFLRNIGYSGYAILDKHILNSLVEFKVIKEKPFGLNRKKYLEIENKMKKFSAKIEINMDELDFVLWSRKTGEVLK